MVRTGGKFAREEDGWKFVVRNYGREFFEFDDLVYPLVGN